MQRPDERQVDVDLFMPTERTAHQELRIYALLVHLLDPLIDEVVFHAHCRIDAAHERLEAPLLVESRPSFSQVARLSLAPAFATIAEPVPVEIRRRELLACPAPLHGVLELLELIQAFLERRLQPQADRLG